MGHTFMLVSDVFFHRVLICYFTYHEKCSSIIFVNPLSTSLWAQKETISVVNDRTGSKLLCQRQGFYGEWYELGLFPYRYQFFLFSMDKT